MMFMHLTQRKELQLTNHNRVNSNVNREIVGELYRSLVLLGAESDLLGTVGSWGDSLPDEDVLANLQGWNEATLKEIKQRIEHYEISFPRPADSQDEAVKTVGQE
jgi:hypothetical protein